MENNVITISKEDYKEAVKKAIVSTIMNVKKENGDGMMLLLIPMIGSIFASEVMNILFGEKDQEEEKKAEDDRTKPLGDIFPSLRPWESMEE